MQDPIGSNTPLYLFLGTVITNLAALVTLWLRDRWASQKEERRRKYELEDRKAMIQEVQQKNEESIQPVKDEISGSAEDRKRLVELLEKNSRDTAETHALIKKQAGPRDRNARERKSDRDTAFEGDKRKEIRRSSDSQTAATSKLAAATDQAAAATSTLAETVQTVSDEQKATARELAIATAKVAVHAVEKTEEIAANAGQGIKLLEDIKATVERIEDKKS